MVRVIAGVDPGVGGAIAFYFPDKPNAVLTFDMPACGGRINGGAVNRIVEKFAPDEVWMEAAFIRPTDGRSSGGKFLRGAGVVEGVFAANQVRFEFLPGLNSALFNTFCNFFKKFDGARMWFTTFLMNEESH